MKHTINKKRIKRFIQSIAITAAVIAGALVINYYFEKSPTPRIKKSGPLIIDEGGEFTLYGKNLSYYGEATLNDIPLSRMNISNDSITLKAPDNIPDSTGKFELRIVTTKGKTIYSATGTMTSDTLHLIPYAPAKWTTTYFRGWQVDTTLNWQAKSNEIGRVGLDTVMAENGQPYICLQANSVSPRTGSIMGMFKNKNETDFRMPHKRTFRSKISLPPEGGDNTYYIVWINYYPTNGVRYVSIDGGEYFRAKDSLTLIDDVKERNRTIQLIEKDLPDKIPEEFTVSLRSYSSNAAGGILWIDPMIIHRKLIMNEE